MAKVAKEPKFDSAAWCRERYAAVVREAFYQEPYLSVTDWASENRILTGHESGRYDPDRCPYQRVIQDCFNDPEVREVTWQSAERVGKSTVGANVLGYIVAREPADILWVMPSREAVADFLKDEIEPMFRSSSTLLQKVSAGRVGVGKTNNIRRKTFLGGTATFVGGGSASPLAFRTVRVVFLDEVDKLKNLKGEGDADALAAKRVSTYGTDFKRSETSIISSVPAPRICRCSFKKLRLWNHRRKRNKSELPAFGSKTIKVKLG
jgi:phage terminase large subunit GpA-like protein